MDQLVNPIEASLVLAVAFVVANDGGQIAGPKSIMSHDAAPYSEVPGPLHSAGREIKSYPSKTARYLSQLVRASSSAHKATIATNCLFQDQGIVYHLGSLVILPHPHNFVVPVKFD